jgi:pyrroline-5-carboxylate reductase
MGLSVLLVGCGNMGRAMLGGWIAENVDPADILVVDPGKANLEAAGKLGVRCYESAMALEQDTQPDVIVLAVKPQMMENVLPTYRAFARKGALVISIAAGTRLARLENDLGADAAVIRTMPNTPAAVRKGMMVSCANGHVTAAQRSLCDRLMTAIGTTAWIEDESLMDAVTGLSGSGPAYVFHMIEAMTAAGIAAGLPEDLATTLARVTVAGAGELVMSSSEPVSQLRENVTSPNGTTAAGLAVLMQEKGLTELMTRTVAAATARSRDLA